MKKILSVCYLLSFIFLFSGCVSSRSSQVYSRDQARRVHTVRYGTITAVREVTIEGTQSSVGTVAGAVTGGALGRTVGGGTGQTLATVVGAIAGGILGNIAEEKLTRKKAFEITVRRDNGEEIAIVQEADVPFYEGDRVRILRDSNGNVRVRK